ncbi:MAG TPA: AI-2E family transporter [Gemmatimonadota bacterium]|nr:AI-2E family transporter [Gemmatimonadota bacterium]
MEPTKVNDGWVYARTTALIGIFVLLSLYTLHFARPFLLPVAVATILSFLLSPVVRGMVRLHVPQGIAAALVILALLGIVAVGIQRLSGPASQWIDRAPEGVERVERRVRGLRRPVEQVQQAAEKVEEEVERLRGNGGDPATREVRVKGGTWTGALLSGTQAFLGTAVVVLILLFFLLASGDFFLRKLIRVLPRLQDKRRAVEIARQTELQISTYLFTVTLINIGMGLCVGLAMWAVGMPNPALWGVVAGLLNFVPYLGALVTLSVITVVSLLTFEDLGRATVAPLVYFAINFTEGSFVTPTVVGRRLTLNPVVVFLGLVFWGWLWGIPGALLAVPLLATFKILCDHIEPLAPIGEFLGR